MTAKELAIALTGREVGMEIMPGEERDAKDAGLVVVYGYSDDNVELCGAINDEVGAYNGTTVYIALDGVLQGPDCGQDDCPYFAREREKAKTIKAVWHDEGGPCWTFETDIPHETFTAMEDGEPFCVGIVFSMEILKTVFPPKYDKPPCYQEEQTNEPYPLCVGRGFANCAHCALWADFEEEQDESRVNPPLTLEQLLEMNGETVWVEMFVKGLKSHWAIVYGKYLSDGRFTGDKERCLLSIDEIGGYGLAYVAYRRKPEEGTGYGN